MPPSISWRTEKVGFARDHNTLLFKSIPFSQGRQGKRPPSPPKESLMDRIAHRRLTRVHSVEDARRAARRVLPRALFDFVDGAAEDEITLRTNRDGFEELMFRPRAGVHVPTPDLATTVAGRPLSLPVLL